LKRRAAVIPEVKYIIRRIELDEAKALAEFGAELRIALGNLCALRRTCPARPRPACSMASPDRPAKFSFRNQAVC